MRRLPGDVWKAMARAHPALLLILLLPTLVLPVSWATADEEPGPTPAPIEPPPDLGTLERDYPATLDRHDQRAYAEQRRLLLAIADLNDDGHRDAVTCGKGADGVAAWYQNDGKGHFARHIIGRGQGSYDTRTVDMDNDGDLDVLIAGHASNNVVWFENPLSQSKTRK